MPDRDIYISNRHLGSVVEEQEVETPTSVPAQRTYMAKYMPGYIKRRLAAGDAASPDPHWYVDAYHCHHCRAAYGKITERSRKHRRKQVRK